VLLFRVVPELKLLIKSFGKIHVMLVLVIADIAATCMVYLFFKNWAVIRHCLSRE
jgi:hypothetical protein